MHPRLCEWLDQTPLFQKVFLAGVFMCLFGIVFWLFVAEPTYQHLELLQQENRALHLKLEKGKKKVARLNEVRTQTVLLEESVQGKKKALGLDVHVGRLLEGVSETAKQRELTVTMWKPGVPVELVSLGILKVPLTLHLEGSYHNIGFFLDQVRDLPKVLTVEGFRMTRVSPFRNGGTKIHVSFALFGYESARKKTVSEVDSFQRMAFQPL